MWKRGLVIHGTDRKFPWVESTVSRIWEENTWKGFSYILNRNRKHDTSKGQQPPAVHQPMYTDVQGGEGSRQQSRAPVTCSSCYGICYSCPELSGIPDKLHRKRRFECLHPSRPAREMQTQVRRQGQHRHCMDAKRQSPGGCRNEQKGQ